VELALAGKRSRLARGRRPVASLRLAAVGLGVWATLAVACGESVISIVDRQSPTAGGGGGAGGAGSVAGGTAGAPDACPEDPATTEPCPCGVGAPTTDLCLLHHYPFDGAGTIATDVVGGADGIVVNTTLSDGTVVLAGGTSDQYVELPPGLFPAWSTVTLEVWTTWDDTEGVWQRILDFGSNTEAPGAQGMGETYVFLTPKDGDGVLKAAFSLAGPGGENLVKGAGPLSSGTLEHLAVVVDGSDSLLSLYSNGTLVGSDGPLRGTLTEVVDENSWLGRSQWVFDVGYAGVLHDLRIFSTARTAEQIAASFSAGPDALPAQ
jgi:hypothetical protein